MQRPLCTTSCRILVLVLVLLAAPPLRAQVVTDGSTGAMSGGTTTVADDMTVGINGPFTRLILNCSARTTASGGGIVERNVAAQSIACCAQDPCDADDDGDDPSADDDNGDVVESSTIEPCEAAVVPWTYQPGVSPIDTLLPYQARPPPSGAHFPPGFLSCAALPPRALFTLRFRSSASAAQGTAFTSHSFLADAAVPANGLHHLAFRVSNAPIGRRHQGAAATVNDLGATNGQFTAAFRPGTGMFAGCSMLTRHFDRIGLAP